MARKIEYAVLIFGIMIMIMNGLNAQEAAEADTSKSEKVQVVVIQPVDNEMKYQTTEFTVKAGTKVRVVMDNIATSEAMQHNVAILKTDANKQEVGIAAINAGEAKGYIPDHKAILFFTPITKPGNKSQVEFTAPPPGDYPYICTFPGHFATMQGVMHSEK